MKDLFGEAILDFQTNNLPENLITETNISEKEQLITAYLFRTFEEMPLLEQKAIQLAYGKVLDVGCGAGSHSLYLQDIMNLDVTAIDISPKAITACKLRNLKNTKNQDVLFYEGEKFDTIILLMNGTGIFKTLNQAPKYLNKLKKLLNSKGQILIDSTDIKYMYSNKELKNLKHYYGELNFKIQYKNKTESEIPWLYLDYSTLKKIAFEQGLNCKIVAKGNESSYLAKLWI